MHNSIRAAVTEGTGPNMLFRTLSTGANMPAIGFGTFGSNHASPEVVAEAVRYAGSIGYRHFDCASVYGNEDRIGHAFSQLFQQGIQRNEVWITSKLWNDNHGESDVIPACQKTLADLQVDYLDLYLVHWPSPNHHPSCNDVSSCSACALPYIHENYMRIWRKMEELVDMGLVRYIGTSNMTIPKMRLLMRDARIKPVANQMELHPHFQQPEFLRYLFKNGIQPIGFSPIGSPAHPERDRTLADTSPVEDPIIRQIARRLDVHPNIVCIKWAIRKRHVPILFSTKRRNILSNLQALTSPPLRSEDMANIDGLDRNCRLTKGQSFRWKENQQWEDLWNPSGEISLA